MEHRENRLGTIATLVYMYRPSFNSTAQETHYTKHGLSYYKSFKKSYYNRRCPASVHDQNIPVLSLLSPVDPLKEYNHPFIFGLTSAIATLN